MQSFASWFRQTSRRRVRRSGTICFVLAVAVVVLVSTCRSTVSPPGATNAVASYVHVGTDREAQEVLETLTKARLGEPSEPAGFIRGLRSVSARRATDGVYGWEVIFQSDISNEERLGFQSRAAGAGLRVIWLGPDDQWPYCSGEDDCQRVNQSGNFP